MDTHSFNCDVQIDSAVLTNVIDKLGEADFYPAVLRMVGNEVPHDLLALARYTTHSPPDLVAPESFDEAAKQRYSEGLYAMDPFYLHWGDKAAPGVITLKEVAPAGMWRSSYATEFLHGVHIRDEVCIFLPPLRGASVTLLIDRATRDFTEVERWRVESMYPLVARLHEIHVRLLLTTGWCSAAVPEMGGRPMRLIDSHGHELYRTPTWQADPSASRVGTMRVPLAADFVLAPGGTIEYVAPKIPGGAKQPPAEFLASLTRRERDIVELTLAGHPTISIARKLELAIGTVKNHRTRIFRKLDITTERELFLMMA